MVSDFLAVDGLDRGDSLLHVVERVVGVDVRGGDGESILQRLGEVEERGRDLFDLGVGEGRVFVRLDQVERIRDDRKGGNLSRKKMSV